MNYLWEVALQADECGKSRESIFYKPAKTCSPYTEASFTDLNTIILEDDIVEANPLFRFSAIFSPIFNPNIHQHLKIRELFFDAVMQYMIVLDLRQGLCKSEYYLRFFLRELLDGVLGDGYAARVRYFTSRELRCVLSCIYTLTKGGCSLILFRKIVKMVYPDSIIYSDRETFREVLIYLGIAETKQEKDKINFLTDIFLPLNFTVHLFWEHHFGIIDIDETMLLDDMVLF